mmetsp:Transcript_14961/g.33236  ORF Transcript_14961/g.33236 Transcript_14961/m.33236 type:complete len:94 (+) Transcript_14961:145-426(+)
MRRRGNGADSLEDASSAVVMKNIKFEAGNVEIRRLQRDKKDEDEHDDRDRRRMTDEVGRESKMCRERSSDSLCNEMLQPCCSRDFGQFCASKL